MTPAELMEGQHVLLETRLSSWMDYLGNWVELYTFENGCLVKNKEFSSKGLDEYVVYNTSKQVSVPHIFQLERNLDYLASLGNVFTPKRCGDFSGDGWILELNDDGSETMVDGLSNSSIDYLTKKGVVVERVESLDDITLIP